jgi:hypothetical protein
MAVEFGLTDGHFNTKYAPLAALAIAYRRRQMLEPLQNVDMRMKTREIEAQAKLTQALVSILAGCETLSEVNTKLRSEQALAQAWGWLRIVDQSTLSRTVNALTQMNIEQLRGAFVDILRQQGQSLQHDWRGYLRLDFDLSGLASSAKAEGSEKGYFSGKKT